MDGTEPWERMKYLQQWKSLEYYSLDNSELQFRLLNEEENWSLVTKGIE